MSRTISMLVILLVSNVAAAAEVRLCVPKTRPDRGNEPRMTQDGTGWSVRVRIDAAASQKVSPNEAADFVGLDTDTEHTVVVMSYDGKQRLLSFKTRLTAAASCMHRKSNYGTWSIDAESDVCRCQSRPN